MRQLHLIVSREANDRGRTGLPHQRFEFLDSFTRVFELDETLGRRQVAAMMHCPRCHTAELVERERTGIQIDICTSCRGVWLDRGELEKLIARDSSASSAGDDNDDQAQPGDRRGRDDDDDDNGRGQGRRRWWDIFD